MSNLQPCDRSVFYTISKKTKFFAGVLFRKLLSVFIISKFRFFLKDGKWYELSKS